MPVTSPDQGLLVGEGKAVSGLECPNRGGEAGEADDPVQHDVGWFPGQLFGGTWAGEEVAAEAVG